MKRSLTWLVVLVAGSSLFAGCQTDSSDRRSTRAGAQQGATADPGSDQASTANQTVPPTSTATQPPTGGAPIVSPPPQPLPTTTGGTGGVSGLNELQSSSGLTYLINAPAPQAGKAYGLLVLLHGSDASNYRQLINTMAKVAGQYDLIRVSALAPDGSGWNEGNQKQNAAQLNQLIQNDLFQKYNIDKSRILFSGQSSGGGFLSSDFVPLYANSYHGGAFLLCGAAPPNERFLPTDDAKQHFRLHFEITSGDPIWPASYAKAVAAYQQLGMQLTKDESKPGGHCNFDQQQVILDHIATILGP